MITAAKSQAQLREAFDSLFYILRENRKETLSTVPRPSAASPASSSAASASSSAVPRGQLQC